MLSTFDDGTKIVLHDPSAAGWTYQTFAHYTDPKGHVYQGYQSLGDETVFTTLPAKGTATYKGISTAYVVTDNNNRQLTSNVMAIVDFGLKGVRFETSNSHFHTLEMISAYPKQIKTTISKVRQAGKTATSSPVKSARPMTS